MPPAPAGTTSATPHLAAFTADGQPDPRLAGQTSRQFDLLYPGGATSLTVDGQGRLLVTGKSKNDFWLARLQANGADDVSFANGGSLRENDAGVPNTPCSLIGCTGVGGRWDLLAPLADGRLLAVGQQMNGVTVYAAFSAAGQLDQQFVSAAAPFLPFVQPVVVPLADGSSVLGGGGLSSGYPLWLKVDPHGGVLPINPLPSSKVPQGAWRLPTARWWYSTMIGRGN